VPVNCGCCGTAPAKDGKGDKDDEARYYGAAPATVVVHVPANAKLSFDKVATRSNAAVRKFVTPSLRTGKTYYYTLTAEMVQDGQKVTASKRVAVRAGRETQVSLEFPAASVAQR
jgi:uncharacterized protein (TIGR03000 family)